MATIFVKAFHLTRGAAHVGENDSYELFIRFLSGTAYAEAAQLYGNVLFRGSVIGEIAESFDVSRQAVYDNIRRTEAMIESYEKKLHLYDRFKERSALLDELEGTVDANDQSGAKDLIQKIKELD